MQDQNHKSEKNNQIIFVRRLKKMHYYSKLSYCDYCSNNILDLEQGIKNIVQEIITIFQILF